MRRTLELAWQERRVGPNQTPRRFLDYVIDGESFYLRSRATTISCLGWFNAEADESAARRLLGEEPPDMDGRVALLVCAECGDTDCGGLTAFVVREGAEIVWRGFANSYFDWGEVAWIHEPALDLADWPEVRFDANEYRATIEGRPPPEG